MQGPETESLGSTSELNRSIYDIDFIHIYVVVDDYENTELKEGYKPGLDLNTNLSCDQIFDNAQLTKGSICYFLANSEPDHLKGANLSFQIILPK